MCGSSGSTALSRKDFSVEKTHIPSRIVAVAAGSLLAALVLTKVVFAADIIDEWETAKVPPKPELKAVTLTARQRRC